MSGSWSAVLLILINLVLWTIIYFIPNLKNKKNIFLVLSFLSLLIFLCIREPYSDLLRYEDFFTRLKVDRIETINLRDWEIGFRFLLYVIRFFTDNTLVLRCILALITLAGPFLFFKRYSKNYLLTIVMFIALGTFSMQFYILRQAIAISIFLAAFHFITDKKMIKYCIAIIFAALFHQTVMVLLILYPLVNIPQSKVKTIITAIITVVSLLLSPLIAKLLVSRFYVEYSDGVVGSGMRLLLLYIGMYMFYAFLLRWVRARKRNKTKISEQNKIGKATQVTVADTGASDEFAVDKSALTTIFWQFFAVQNNMFCRLANYTRDSFCVLVPNSIQDLGRREKIVCSVGLIIACVGFILMTDRLGWYSILW